MKRFDDPKFQTELASRLSQLDVEQVEAMMPISRKAGFYTGEIRDTADPSLVTEMLMAILASLGKPVEIRRIQKRIRDDVLWNDCLLPWRRSPLWLTIRIAIQTTLTYMLPMSQALPEYKRLMLFVLTEIASRASAANIPHDIRHVIIAKIARRALKLGPGFLGSVRDRALETCQVMKEDHELVWQSIVKADADRPVTIDKRPFEHDTSLSLHHSKPYLDFVLGLNYDAPELQPPFDPQCDSWLHWSLELPVLKAHPLREENIYALAEFESWVSDSLSVWKQQRLASSGSNNSHGQECRALAALAKQYLDLSLPIYDHVPEQKSMMILVILELWHALDALTVRSLPLLRHFSPTIPSDLFNPLLLSKRSCMQRLQNIELYIAARQSRAKLDYPSVFSDPRSKTFAVQYYATSPRLQALRRRIEDDATALRSLKEVQWRELSEDYRRLKDDAKSESCITRRNCDGETYHPADCPKCNLNRRAAAMTIDVHEWPLPRDEFSCISAVFELDCPVEFVAWRDLTWTIVHDLARKQSSNLSQPAVSLFCYAGLKEYAEDKGSRLTLASTTKPFAKSHYKTLKFPVDSHSS